MTHGVEELLGLLEPGDRADLLNNLVKWEKRTDRIEQSVSMQLSGIAQQELSPELSARLAAFSHQSRFRARGRHVVEHGLANGCQSP